MIFSEGRMLAVTCAREYLVVAPSVTNTSFTCSIENDAILIRFLRVDVLNAFVFACALAFRCECWLKRSVMTRLI